jgi:hypothetical protein
MLDFGHKKLDSRRLYIISNFNNFPVKKIEVYFL